MTEIVIAVYRPREGKEAELLACLREHVATLRDRGLVTAREEIVARSRRDGTIVEIFEWKSPEAVQHAHSDPVVSVIWRRLSECAEYATLGSLRESADIFPHFEPAADERDATSE